MPNAGLVTLVLIICLFYRKARGEFFALTILAYLITIKAGYILCTAYLLTVSALFIPAIRRKLITHRIILLIQKLKLLPKISETEKIALTSGTVWVDGQLFSGKPDFTWIFSQKYPSLTLEEKKFLDNETEELCNLCNDYEVQRLRDLPEPVWQFLKEKRFFGMIIPKEFGGLGFSAYAHSCVIEKLSSRSVPLAITAMVPNSLGPAELLLHYGTKSQQDYYLPRLANGVELPCFALTEPTAGSDATSIISNGVLFKDHDGEIKIRLNWNKRYITLGAYATLIGVAFKLLDPDHLLFEIEDIGITCALVPHNTAGVRQGRRHDPLSTPFVNSPLNGENVVVSLDAVIGAKDGLGKGWKMLMECLAAGRGISLPSTSSGGSKLITRFVTAYASIRKQFGTPIAKFEGIEEVIARISARTYALDAMRIFTAGAVDSGAKPAAVTAIAKYQATEMFRKNINDGMDIAGGSGIIRGPRNVLAGAYFSAPISITVEGANIMTRSLIQFGQGAMLCHPHAYKEVLALESQDLNGFDHEFFAHINHFIGNVVRSILLSLTRGYLIKPLDKSLVTKYERKIAWCSATFAVLADIAMMSFGGNLKRKEKINGRFGDVMSAMYISTSILRKFIAGGCNKEEEYLVEYAIKEQLCNAQIAIEGLYQNLFSGAFKKLFCPIKIWSRTNPFFFPSSDLVSHKITKAVTKSGALRDGITEGIFIPKSNKEGLGRVEQAFQLQEKSLPISDKIKQAIKEGKLPNKPIESLIEQAFEAGIINLEEKHLLLDVKIAVLDAIQVDEYSLEEYSKL